MERWFKCTKLTNHNYSLPNNAIGKRFILILGSEFDKLVKTDVLSERVVIYLSTILHKNKMVKKSKDISILVKYRLDLWEENKFDILIKNVFDSRVTPNSRKLDMDQVYKTFRMLLLSGKIREEVNYVSNQ